MSNTPPFQDKFDQTIGQSHRLLSQLAHWGKINEGLDSHNKQTLKRHAESMKAVAQKILEDLGETEEEPKPWTVYKDPTTPCTPKELVDAGTALMQDMQKGKAQAEMAKDEDNQFLQNLEQNEDKEQSITRRSFWLECNGISSSLNVDWSPEDILPTGGLDHHAGIVYMLSERIKEKLPLAVNSLVSLLREKEKSTLSIPEGTLPSAFPLLDRSWLLKNLPPGIVPVDGPTFKTHDGLDGATLSVRFETWRSWNMWVHKRQEQGATVYLWRAMVYMEDDTRNENTLGTRWYFVAHMAAHVPQKQEN